MGNWMGNVGPRADPSPRAQLTSTIQNDILKEFIMVRKTYIYPPTPTDADLRRHHSIHVAGDAEAQLDLRRVTGIASRDRLQRGLADGFLDARHERWGNAQTADAELQQRG